MKMFQFQAVFKYEMTYEIFFAPFHQHRLQVLGEIGGSQCVSHLCDQGSVPALRNSPIKIHIAWSPVRKVLSNLNLLSTAAFLWILRFPP